MAQKKRALITGINGQVGSFLSELLLEKDYEVHGLVRKASTFSTERIDHLIQGHPTALYSERFKLHYYDLADPMPLVALLEKVEPDEVYNLAAQSHVGVSFQLPVATGLHTGLSTATMLEAIRVSGSRAKFYQASSSELFGNEPAPQGLHTPINPRSPYAAAKAYAYWMTKIYREAYGMFAVNGILFNTESERRNPTFVTRKITQGIARIKLGLQDKILLGNVHAERDWGFAGDYVEAIYKMMQCPTPGDWVVATGRSYSVLDFLRLAVEFAGISKDFRTLYDIDDRYARPLEVDHLCGDSLATENALQWCPKYSLGALIERMVRHDIDEQMRLNR